MKELDVSVVILTKNSARTIEKCLMSVEAGKPFEIIAVDGQSTDGTLSILKKHRVEVLSEDKGSYGYARQLGVEAAKSPYVMFVDSDVELGPGCIVTLREEIGALGWAGIHAMILSGETVTYWQSAEDKLCSLFFNHPGPKSSIPMVAALFRREVLVRYPFDPNMKHSAEDADLCLRLGQNGHIVGVTRAYAYHRHRREFSAFAKRNFKFGLGVTQLALKYKSIRLLAGPMTAAVGDIPHIVCARMLETIPHRVIAASICFSGAIIGLAEAHQQ